jgi:hypothetical protein
LKTTVFWYALYFRKDKKMKIFIVVIILLSLAIPSFAQFGNETITITTYYPSPYGVYRNLELFPSPEPTGPTVKRGVMFFNETSNEVMVHNGSQFVRMGGRGGGTVEGVQNVTLANPIPVSIADLGTLHTPHGGITSDCTYPCSESKLLLEKTFTVDTVETYSLIEGGVRLSGGCGNCATFAYCHAWLQLDGRKVAEDEQICPFQWHTLRFYDHLNILSKGTHTISIWARMGHKEDNEGLAGTALATLSVKLGRDITEIVIPADN